MTIPAMLERVGLYLHTFPIAAQARKILLVGTNPVGVVYDEYALQDPRAVRLAPVPGLTGLWLMRRDGMG